MKIPTVIIDKKEFYNMWQIKLNDILYCFLIDVNDNSNCLIRRLENDGEKDYLCGLNSEEEFNLVMQEFIKKFDKSENMI